MELKNLFSVKVCSHNNLSHLFPAIGGSEVEHHACAYLEHLLPYSRHFFANAQGAPSNYFRLLEKHGRELVWTLIGIVQTVGSRNGDAVRNSCFYLKNIPSCIVSP